MSAPIHQLVTRPAPGPVYATDGVDARHERLLVHVPHRVDFPGGLAVRAGRYPLLRRLDGNRLVVGVSRYGWWREERWKPKNPPAGPHKAALCPGEYDAIEEVAGGHPAAQPPADL